MDENIRDQLIKILEKRTRETYSQKSYEALKAPQVKDYTPGTVKVLQQQLLLEDIAALPDAIVNDTDTLVSLIQGLVSRPRKTKSEVNAELSNLYKVLNSLSSQARVHLRLTSKQLENSEVDALGCLLRASSVEYTSLRADRETNIIIAHYAHGILTKFGIPCTAEENGAFVKYLNILGDLLKIDNFSGLNQAQNFHKFFPK